LAGNAITLVIVGRASLAAIIGFGDFPAIQSVVAGLRKKDGR